MPYKATTPAQRAALNMLFSVHRKGVVRVAGPHPDTGELLWSVRTRESTDAGVMDRDGKSKSWQEAGLPSPTEFYDGVVTPRG